MATAVAYSKPPPVFPASRAEAQSMFGGGVDDGAEDAEERGDVDGGDRGR